jgi:hypothetical protein
MWNVWNQIIIIKTVYEALFMDPTSYFGSKIKSVLRITSILLFIYKFRQYIIWR